MTSDPYRQLELYIQEVEVQIGGIIDNVIQKKDRRAKENKENAESVFPAYSLSRSSTTPVVSVPYQLQRQRSFPLCPDLTSSLPPEPKPKVEKSPIRRCPSKKDSAHVRVSANGAPTSKFRLADGSWGRDVPIKIVNEPRRVIEDFHYQGKYHGRVCLSKPILFDYHHLPSYPRPSLLSIVSNGKAIKKSEKERTCFPEKDSPTATTKENQAPKAKFPLKEADKSLNQSPELSGASSLPLNRSSKRNTFSAGKNDVFHDATLNVKQPKELSLDSKALQQQTTPSYSGKLSKSSDEQRSTSQDREDDPNPEKIHEDTEKTKSSEASVSGSSPNKTRSSAHKRMRSQSEGSVQEYLKGQSDVRRFGLLEDLYWLNDSETDTFDSKASSPHSSISQLSRIEQDDPVLKPPEPTASTPTDGKTSERAAPASPCCLARSPDHNSAASSSTTSGTTSPLSTPPSGSLCCLQNPDITKVGCPRKAAPRPDVCASAVRREPSFKSSSAPLLEHSTSPAPSSNLAAEVAPRSKSVQELRELEAAEACAWLKAAGFPQYAQMYEDNQFPINIESVQRDHVFLDPDSFQSLFRRLNTLNKCASMKLDHHHHHPHLSRKSSRRDNDEEDECALSENWQFLQPSRRWSRVPLVPSGLSPTRSRPDDNVFIEESSPEGRRAHQGPTIIQYDSHFLMPTTPLDDDDDMDKDLLDSSLRRSGSERLRDSARALLRRMENLRGKKKKKTNHQSQTNGPSSPHQDEGTCHSGGEDSSQHSTPQCKHRKRCFRVLNRGNTEGSAFSDSEFCWKEGAPPSEEASPLFARMQAPQPPPSERTSLYDNVPTPTFAIKQPSCSIDLEERVPNEKGTNEDDVLLYERKDSGVGSSLPRSAESASHVPPWSCLTPRPSLVAHGAPTVPSPMEVAALSAPQMTVLRKLSLLKLTTLMEKYTPASRAAGWNWPKFIRRMRTPNYKDKSVFGVPLVVVVQRTGRPLPPQIRTAMTYLRSSALDCTGLFRKPGVRSRIQKLRNLNETTGPEGHQEYEAQQVYDVADMLKMYFRELPESLFTNKLSEIFISIFQHIPESLRLEAVQAAVLLMPDENREVLLSLLAFLREVCEHSGENQMSAGNLAVCFAPSLFHLCGGGGRSASASPLRSGGNRSGVPDQRELAENRAAHECLTSMINNFQTLVSVPEDSLWQCRLSCLGQWEPVSLDDLGSSEGSSSPGSSTGWRAYADQCIAGVIKEVKDKSSKNLWTTVTDHHGPPGVEIAYRSVQDGHPLRLWKVTLDIEAPPSVLLGRVLRERHVWDETLLKWRTIARLDKQAEVFQYVTSSVPPFPPIDFCVLRVWQSGVPKPDACVLVETSVDHPDAPLLQTGVRGVVLASRYLMEPCGTGKTRLTHISRVDLRGHSPEWYHKVYGHLCALMLSKLRTSFLRPTSSAGGPETKV